MSFPEILGAAWLNERAFERSGMGKLASGPSLSLAYSVTLASAGVSLSPPMYLEQ